LEATVSERQPKVAVNCTDQWDDDARQPAAPDDVMPWAEARDRLAAATLYWVATVRAGNGAPHVRPVFAVWVDGLLCSTTNGARAKARNLAANPQVSFTTHTDEVDFIVEGTAAPVSDGGLRGRIAAAYRDKYGWPLTERDGELYAPYGAPAAGPPPYRPYAVTPDVVYGMGTTEALAPLSTRWRF
jgi:hypothetical protein